MLRIKKFWKQKRHSVTQALLSAGRRHSAKFGLCRVPGLQPSAKDNGHQPRWRPAHGGRACWARALPLPCASPPALGKDQLCRVPSFCRRPALGRDNIYHVPWLCRVPKARHSANGRFAECLRSGTRQSPRHSAIWRFLVVIVIHSSWVPVKETFSVDVNWNMLLTYGD